MFRPGSRRRHRKHGRSSATVQCSMPGPFRSDPHTTHRAPLIINGNPVDEPIGGRRLRFDRARAAGDLALAMGSHGTAAAKQEQCEGESKPVSSHAVAILPLRRRG
jgi:hypothetical protein